MNLAYKKILGKFTKVLGFGKTPPPHVGKNSQIISFFLERTWAYQSIPDLGRVAAGRSACGRFGAWGQPGRGVHPIAQLALRHGSTLDRLAIKICVSHFCSGWKVRNWRVLQYPLSSEDEIKLIGNPQQAEKRITMEDPTTCAFYLTRVRSLSTLVSNWLTDRLLLSRLDWCDPGMSRC